MSSLPFVILSYEERFKTTKRLFSILEPYINEVVSKPERLDSIVDKVFRDNRVFLLMLASSYEILEKYKKTTSSLLTIIVDSIEAVKEKLSRHGINLDEILETLIEHDLFKIRLIIEKPDKLAHIMVVFATKYLDDLIEYVRVYLALVLLLSAINKTSNPDKLRKLAEHLEKYAEIIDVYTITFELMLEPVDNKDVHSSHRTLKSLREVLYSEQT